MVSACLEAYRATSDVWWYEQAQRAFDWFIGWNDLGLELYSSESGGCGDGLHVDRVNRNEGAESTLAFLLSLAEMRLAQNMLTSFKADGLDRSLRHPMIATSLQVKRTSTILKPDQTRVLLRPFSPGGPERIASDYRQNHGDPGRSGRFPPEGNLRRILAAAPAHQRISFWNASNRSASSCRQIEEAVHTETTPDRLLFPGRIFSGIRCAVQSLYRSASRPDRAAGRRAAVSFSACAPLAKDTFPPSRFEPVSFTPISGSRYLPPTGFLTEPRQIPNPAIRERRCSSGNFPNWD